MKAKDYKCIECGKKSDVFYPAVDLDIKSYPYCRKCVDEIKLRLLIKLTESKPIIKEFKPIEHKNLKSPK